MEYVLLVPKYLSDLGITGLLLAPFLIWIIGVIFWTGFFFPIVEAFSKNKENGERFEKKYKYIWKMGSRRTIYYKWEILFSSASGIVFTNIYWLILSLSEEFLPSFLYIIILFVSSFSLVTLLFAKGNSIMSNKSTSPIRSFKYLFWGFQNPFKKSELDKMREVVKKVNKEVENIEK